MTICKRKLEIEFCCHILFVVITFVRVSLLLLLFIHFLFALMNCCGWWQQQLMKKKMKFSFCVRTLCVRLWVLYDAFKCLHISYHCSRVKSNCFCLRCHCAPNKIIIFAFIAFARQTRRNNRIGDGSDSSFLFSVLCEIQNKFRFVRRVVFNSCKYSLIYAIGMYFSELVGWLACVQIDERTMI